jgi:general stress protein 26
MQPVPHKDIHMATIAESELKEQFWAHMGDSPIVMLELDHAPHTAAPMTAQLDREADSAIWFFTSRDGPLGRRGAATATFAAKDHTLFTRFAGRLTEEKSRDVLEKLWTNAIAAWFPEGKHSPQVLLLRMDLGKASIWSAKLGVWAWSKMLLGFNVRDGVRGHHTRTSL